ncbi:MAG TPA: hypothetical protein VHT70_05140 [Candidatus Saccharimonadales bacterium]|jgi:hypothetical protein|nr:hypothetical protein [Candidatus Saccharimonadales bacterium]
MFSNSQFRIPTNEEVTALDPSVRAEMAAALLQGLEPGRQPLELFKQLCRLTVATTVEIVPIRTQGEEPEVWLGQRSESDPWWPSKWILPGVVILPNDTRDDENTLAGPIERLFETDLKGIGRIGDLHQLPSQFRFDGRGTEVTTQYWTEVETGNEPYQGQFFRVADLRETEPEGGLIEEGWLTIDRAITDYEALRGQSQ